MLSLNLLRVYRACDRVFIRNLRSRGRISHFGPNPGLNKRLDAFKQDGIEIEAEDAEEFIEGSNSDLVESGKAYSSYLHETFIGKHQLPKKIVQQKYFKENMPNLLTWSEKEQIRHLATEHPDEWTPDRIAESFPVTVSVVKKLLKYPWKPATEQRIARHDASAMRNWRELKEGLLPIPEELKDHFMKFSERTLPPVQATSIKKDITPKQNIGEFQSIVEKCAANELTTPSDKDNTKVTKLECTKTKTHKKHDKTLLTLEELTDKIKSRVDTSSELNLPDQLIVDSVRSTEATNKESNYPVILEQNKTSILPKREEVVLKTYPERIRIPKKAYKRDATYKVDDCFYDHDGRFLYRVIGMTGK